MSFYVLSLIFIGKFLEKWGTFGKWPDSDMLKNIIAFTIYVMMTYIKCSATAKIDPRTDQMPKKYIYMKKRKDQRKAGI